LDLLEQLANVGSYLDDLPFAPRQQTWSRSIDDPALRARIAAVVERLVVR
jgi:hypothetical protein